MLKFISIVEGVTPFPAKNHSCYFVSVVDELRAGRTFKRKGYAGRKAAVEFMWRIINDAAKGKHQHDVYGEITSQKLFAVEFSSPDGNFASVLIAHVNSDDEANLIRQATSETFKEAYMFADVDEF